MIRADKIKELIVEPDHDQLLDVVDFAKYVLTKDNTKQIMFFWNIYTGKFKVNVNTNNINISGYEFLKTMTFTYNDLLKYTDLKEDSFIYTYKDSSTKKIVSELKSVIEGMKQKLYNIEMTTYFDEEELLIKLIDINDRNVPHKYDFYDVNPVTIWPKIVKDIYLEYFLNLK